MMRDEPVSDDEALITAITRPGGQPDPFVRKLRAVREELCRPPAASTRWNHMAAMRRAREDARRRGPRSMMTIAVATVGVVGLSTGLAAAAGYLPAPAQAQAARLAKVVGVDIPGRDDHQPSKESDRTKPVPGGATVDARRSGAPASADERPGAGGTTPGRSVPAPGTLHAPGQVAKTTDPSTDAPGNSGNAPGHTGETPGQGGTPPGQSESAPGNSGNAPGHTGETPGQRGTAPGQVKQNATDATSVVPPGQDAGGPGNSESAPGHADGASPSSFAPGQSKKNAGQ